MSNPDTTNYSDVTENTKGETTFSEIITPKMDGGQKSKYNSAKGKAESLKNKYNYLFQNNNTFTDSSTSSTSTSSNATKLYTSTDITGAIVVTEQSTEELAIVSNYNFLNEDRMHRSTSIDLGIIFLALFSSI